MLVVCRMVGWLSNKASPIPLAASKGYGVAI